MRVGVERLSVWGRCVLAWMTWAVGGSVLALERNCNENYAGYRVRYIPDNVRVSAVVYNANSCSVSRLPSATTVRRLYENKLLCCGRICAGDFVAAVFVVFWVCFCLAASHACCLSLFAFKHIFVSVPLALIFTSHRYAIFSLRVDKLFYATAHVWIRHV